MSDVKADDALVKELATLLITELNLEMAPEEVTADMALYGDGLGLDSIDILEVALAVSQRYGFHSVMGGRHGCPKAKFGPPSTPHFLSFCSTL